MSKCSSPIPEIIVCAWKHVALKVFKIKNEQIKSKNKNTPAHFQHPNQLGKLDPLSGSDSKLLKTSKWDKKIYKFFNGNKKLLSVEIN